MSSTFREVVMAQLYYRYGQGKTADLCQTAYNYNEIGSRVIVINADNNKKVEANLVGTNQNKLVRNVDYELDNNKSILDDIFNMERTNLKCIFVDNASLLTEKQVNELFYIVNLLNINVITYGNRIDNGISSSGSMRIMELANVIEPVDGGKYISRSPLTFYYGAMNSSKTAKLLYKSYALQKEGLKVCLIKPKLDRDINYIESRIGLKEKANIVLDKDDAIYGEGYYMSKDHINYILVDEAQFLTVKQIDELTRINKEYGIPIRCYGLKTDFMTNHFSGSGRLLEISDELVKLKTVCDCGEGAEFNARTSSGEYIRSGEQISIDNNDNIKYNSLCPKCYIKKVMGIDNIQKLIK